MARRARHRSGRGDGKPDAGALEPFLPRRTPLAVSERISRCVAAPVLATPSSMVTAHTVLLIAAPNESAEAQQRALEDAGMTVRRAHDGLSGMRDALGDRPDAVVLDFAADDSADVLRSRRALREAGIPLLVLVDGHIDDEERAGGEDIRFLARPVEAGTLAAEAKRIMRPASRGAKR